MKKLLFVIMLISQIYVKVVIYHLQAHIKAVKLLMLLEHIGEVMRNNKQLTRIYGISFPKQKLLTEYLQLVEEAKKRDHRE